MTEKLDEQGYPAYVKGDPKYYDEQPHGYTLCADCEFSPAENGLCLLDEAWRDSGLDNDYISPCRMIKGMRELAVHHRDELHMLDKDRTDYLEQLKRLQDKLDPIVFGLDGYKRLYHAQLRRASLRGHDTQHVPEDLLEDERIGKKLISIYEDSRPKNGQE